METGRTRWRRGWRLVLFLGALAGTARADTNLTPGEIEEFRNAIDALASERFDPEAASLGPSGSGWRYSAFYGSAAYGLYAGEISDAMGALNATVLATSRGRPLWAHAIELTQRFAQVTSHHLLLHSQAAGVLSRAADMAAAVRDAYPASVRGRAVEVLASTLALRSSALGSCSDEVRIDQGACP